MIAILKALGMCLLFIAMLIVGFAVGYERRRSEETEEQRREITQRVFSGDEYTN